MRRYEEYVGKRVMGISLKKNKKTKKLKCTFFYTSARKQKERKTEEEVGGPGERRSEREGTVRRGGVRPS